MKKIYITFQLWYIKSFTLAFNNLVLLINNLFYKRS